MDQNNGYGLNTSVLNMTNQNNMDNMEESYKNLPNMTFIVEDVMEKRMDPILFQKVHQRAKNFANHIKELDNPFELNRNNNDSDNNNDD